MIFFLAAVSGIASGKLSDQWIAAGDSPTRVRKTLLGVGQIGVGFSLVAVAFASDSVFVWALAPAGLFVGLGGGNCWGGYSNPGGPESRGALGRCAEFHWQLCWCRSSDAHRIFAGPNRPILLAALDLGDGGLDRSTGLGVSGWADRTSGLGK